VRLVWVKISQCCPTQSRQSGTVMRLRALQAGFHGAFDFELKKVVSFFNLTDLGFKPQLCIAAVAIFA